MTKSPLLALLLLSVASHAALPRFDFRDSTVAREWGQPHDLVSGQSGPDGLELAATGSDPYLHGPPRDYPTNMPLWVIVRVKSDQAGPAELFYFRDQARGGDSVQFQVPAGVWTERRVPMPSLGAGYRLRFDPPGDGTDSRGRVVLGEIRFESRQIMASPVWPRWSSPVPGAADAIGVRAGPVTLIFSPPSGASLELRVHGRSTAFRHPFPRAAYLHQDQIQWLDWSKGSARLDQPERNSLVRTSRLTDDQGAEWTWRESFLADGPGAIRVESTVSVSADREVLFLPMHQWIAGEQSFGRRKGQGLLAGLEYLDDEPSRLEADIVGPEANRRVPAGHKLTFPLMAIQADGRYVGLIWDDPIQFAALFDSPDRTYDSGGHLLGVIFPGSDGQNREEGSLLPYSGQWVKAGQSVRSRAWIIGGGGSDLVPAIQHYVRVRGWPARPDPGLSFQRYVALAAQGWQTSKIREGTLYRHAYWPGFKPQPAADAAVWQLWLAGQSSDPSLSAALGRSATNALSAVPRRSFYQSAIGHVRPPLAPLVFGDVSEAVEAARRVARAQLDRFQPDGTHPYEPSAGGPDYGRTHFSREANGLTAQAVATLLEASAFCGDAGLIAEGLGRLRDLGKFRHGAPRGAQTWEVPLHTPDILASAHLIRAYTLGYELTGEREFLDLAIEWAWTGVPFVYLVNPTGQPVGPYSTIAVLGATSWKAPVWFGRPVQWCGLVYAHSLLRLARHDSGGPWKNLADGIAAAGLQHTWPSEDSDRAGLLPDFFELGPQLRAGPAINPATLASGAAHLFGRGPVYDFRVLPARGLRVHAAGAIVSGSDTVQESTFTVLPWTPGPSFVLVNGLDTNTARPTVIVDGQPAATLYSYSADGGYLIIEVPSHGAEARIVIR